MTSLAEKKAFKCNSRRPLLYFYYSINLMKCLSNLFKMVSVLKCVVYSVNISTRISEHIRFYSDEFVHILISFCSVIHLKGKQLCHFLFFNFLPLPDFVVTLIDQVSFCKSKILMGENCSNGWMFLYKSDKKVKL